MREGKCLVRTGICSHRWLNVVNFWLLSDPTDVLILNIDISSCQVLILLSNTTDIHRLLSSSYSTSYFDHLIMCLSDIPRHRLLFVGYPTIPVFLMDAYGCALSGSLLLCANKEVRGANDIAINSCVCNFLFAGSFY